jgi:hypothetical protein
MTMSSVEWDERTEGLRRQRRERRVAFIQSAAPHRRAIACSIERLEELLGPLPEVTTYRAKVTNSLKHAMYDLGAAIVATYEYGVDAGLLPQRDEMSRVARILHFGAAAVRVGTTGFCVRRYGSLPAAQIARFVEGVPSWVYFIQQRCECESAPIKIGVAKDPFARLASLQTGSPHQLEIVGLIDGDWAVEKEMHRRFADARMEGEWFRPSTALVEFVQSLSAKP